MSRLSAVASDDAGPASEPARGTAHNELALLRFGQMEGRILNTLWMFGEITLTEMQLLLSDAMISQSSLRATLEKLHVKRLIRIRKVNRTAFYRPSLQRPDFIHALHTQLYDFLGESGMESLKNTTRA